MKIVINAYSARIGGGRTYLRNILSHIPADGEFAIGVFCPDDFVLPEDPRVIRLSTSFPTTNPLLRALWERFLLPRELARMKADILFCPGGVLTTRPPRGCATVTMFRNMEPFDVAQVRSMPWGLARLRNLLLRRVMLKSLATADLSIFISDYARGLISALTAIPNPVTIPHGIGDPFRSVPGKHARPTAAPAQPYILYVSRFERYKHHHEVVEAFAQLPDAVRADRRLVFVGENDLPETGRVVRRIAELGLNERIILQGAISHTDLPAWYANAELVLFASSCENCPNILLEALGSGRPVIASNIMPMPEFGGVGLDYFSPADPKSIRAAIQRVLMSPEHAEALARYAVNRSERYDWAATAQQTWGHILSLKSSAESQTNRVGEKLPGCCDDDSRDAGQGMSEIHQRLLAPQQVQAFYHDDFVESQTRDFLALVPSIVPGADLLVDVGGGCGFFAGRVKEQTGIKVRVMDLDTGSIKACRDRGIDAELGDALNPTIRGDEDVVSFNLILHHMVGSSNFNSRTLQEAALRPWRRRVKALFVNEYIYDSYAGNLSGWLIYTISSSKPLSAIAALVARFVPSLQANTFGIGVRFRSHAEWMSLFDRLGYRVAAYRRGPEETVSIARRLLLIKSCRRDSFVLVAA